MATRTSSASSESELNTWLVEEMYEQYLEDPSQLPRSWQDFFADYRPEGSSATPIATDEEAAPAASTAPATEEPKSEPATDEADQEPGRTEERIRGVGATIVRNMEQSLGIPTATSVRDVPAKLLEVNRRIINNYLGRTRGGRVSFTHVIAYAIVKAVEQVPAMANTYGLDDDDKPILVRTDDFGLGLAVDLQKDDGSRTLLVPVIQQANGLDFESFVNRYEELIRKIRTNKIDPAMFSGATITLTNPGMIGTVHSMPRLMEGQAAIIGAGALDFPAEYQATDRATLAKLGVGKVMTLTSTYDHRVVQGAESGQFLRIIHEMLLGEHGFYDDVFESLGLPYEPARWRPDTGAFDSPDVLLEKQMHVDQLANMYRVRGHLIADLDPLRQKKPAMHPELDPTYYNLSIWDLEREFLTDIGGGTRKLDLGAILGTLRDAYCRTIGIEYGHVLDPEQKRWWREQVEGVSDEATANDQLWILERLNAAEAFEGFLHTKYVGQKRFGLEGAESLIPLLDTICESAADEENIDDIVLGMAHRGRLNVLVNIVGKQLNQLFREFQGDIDEDTVQGSGDVKYHLGQQEVYKARSGKTIAMHMPPNPSHLEAVDPIVEGMARAMEDAYDRGGEGIFPVLPLLMHGDSAFAGQGVVGETLNLSLLPGYRTGGTIHVVVNNQVGFTTAPESARSSHYSTDIAKFVQAPILHVNGDDPEAVVRVARLAYAYRQQFHRDIVIDMVCYRRHGHNEADDPSFTQPEMYDLIDNHRSVRKLYTERLVRRGDISVEKAAEFLDDFEARMERAFEQTKQARLPDPPIARRPEEIGPLPHVETGVKRDILDAIAEKQFVAPQGFNRHPKLERIFKKAMERYDKGVIDWSLGETLAFGSLLWEGTTVRLAGQDTQRGTFSHRHAAQVDKATGEVWKPLQNLHDEQGKWLIYDSSLSEYAAVGFEYGYATVARDSLVCWEAQFGDFVNGAQVIIDQFIVAAEDKWGELSGLVMLLPHGYEGQGPEHSSARIERFLTLAAEDNIQVVNATTSAQYFHVLRRQMHREVRKPLVIFTPKSLLRSANAFSDVSELETGSFQEVIDDDTVESRQHVTTVALSFGKVVYDAREAIKEAERTDIATVRVEQCYPFPADQIRDALKGYPEAKDVVWLQEEPRNMGAWDFVDGRLWNILDELGDGRKLRCVARVASASPAAGQHVVHDQERKELFDELLAGPSS